MNRTIFISFLAIAILLLDFYVFQAVKNVTGTLSPGWRKFVYVAYWSITVITFAGIIAVNFFDIESVSRTFRNFIIVWIFIHVIAKTFAIIFLLIDDLVRLIRWAVYKISASSKNEAVLSAGKKISRSEFLSRTALVAGAIPAVTMSFGIISGAHNYRVHRKTIYLPNLPKEFDGMRIGQLSDIHSGSFFNKKAVNGGVGMFMAEKPDLIFFTGDLVNNSSDEIKEYINVFNQVKAPLGVFSTLGNHDYGDYRQWPSPEAKKQNFQDLLEAHKALGWDLLNNVNRTVTVDNAQIGIIGVENWGKGRFPKYGDLQKAYQGMQDLPVKLLLSHDPSHWNKQVLPGYQDIDITFSGHTHGFQFGVEIGDWKWSPSKFVYEQWAGLYQQNNQFLYVNRGFGFIGYPGRIGIWPEVTIIELKRGEA
jgi:uncharacterized protein